MASKKSSNHKDFIPEMCFRPVILMNFWLIKTEFEAVYRIIQL